MRDTQLDGTATKTKVYGNRDDFAKYFIVSKDTVNGFLDRQESFSNQSVQSIVHSVSKLIWGEGGRTAKAFS